MLDITSDNVPRFIAKKWVEVHDKSGSAADRYNPSKQVRFKTSMLRLDYYCYCCRSKWCKLQQEVSF